MKLRYSEIPDGGVRLAFRGEDAPWEGMRGFSVETAPSGHLFVQKRGRDVFIEGDAAATLSFECSRCLERFPHTVAASFRQMLSPKENDRIEAREIELKAEDLEHGSYDEDNIPLTSIIEEQLLLSLPMQPLCKADCKGLCPRCGSNRNVEDCPCLAMARESPFDSLKKFVVMDK